MPEISDWAKGPFAFLGSIPAFTQGDYEKGVQGLVNSGGFLAFAAYRYKGNKETQEAFKVETKVLWYGILYIMTLQMLYLKATDTGKEYKASKSDFEAAVQSLESATVEDWGGWTGDGADAYQTQNELQKDRAEKMAELDAEIYDILAKETKQVKRAVLNLGWEQAALTCMIPFCSLIYKTNPALSLKTQVTAVTLAVLASIDIVNGTIKDSSHNADDIHTRRESYREQGAGAAASLQQLTTDTGSQGEMSSSAEVSVAKFGTLNTAAPAAGPGTGMPTSRISGAEEVDDRVAADAGNGGDRVGQSSGGNRAYPVATGAPTASRASRGSTQAAPLSRHAPAPAGPAGASAPPAAREGAAGGADGAERAPVADGAPRTSEPDQIHSR